MGNETTLKEQETQKRQAEFAAFLKTKGIKAKFSLAFAAMHEEACLQQQKDLAAFEARKQLSREENKAFDGFLHTRGFKAKCQLVLANLRQGAKKQSPKDKKPAPISPKAVDDFTLDDDFDDFLFSVGLLQAYHTDMPAKEALQ